MQNKYTSNFDQKAHCYVVWFVRVGHLDEFCVSVSSALPELRVGLAWNLDLVDI